MIDPAVALYHLNELLIEAKDLIAAHRDTPAWTLQHAYLHDAVTRVEIYNRAALEGQPVPSTSHQIERIELLIATTGTDLQAVLTAYKVPDLAHLTYDQADLIIARQRNLRHKQRLTASSVSPTSHTSQEPPQ